jgi:hypothetical protein
MSGSMRTPPTTARKLPNRGAALARPPVFGSLLMLAAQAALGQSAQDQLFARILDGASCKQTAASGLICTYRIGDALSISITDVGGTDTQVSFLRSNANDEFFAALYSGCVMVVPGKAHVRTNDPVTNVYVSPRNGRIYKTVGECHAGK